MKLIEEILERNRFKIHGEADARVSVEEERHLADNLPNAKSTIVPEAGHVPTMTRPLGVAHEITSSFGSEI